MKSEPPSTSKHQRIPLSFHRRKPQPLLPYSVASSSSSSARHYSVEMLSETASSASATSNASVFVSRTLVSLVLMGLVSLSCFVIYRSSAHFSDFLVPTAIQASTLFSQYLLPSPETDENKLERVLNAASMPDKTVILTTLNEAWAAPNSIIDLFLESFRIGDCTHEFLNHLVIIALDQKAYSRCLLLHKHCYALVTEGIDFSKEAYFMTPEYLKMMWRRIDFLRSVLEMGYNFIFTDADIMWFRNPFPHFFQNADFQIACDHFSGDPDDVENKPNGGFMFVKSNNRSIELYKFWYSSRETYPGLHDQDVLNNIKYDKFLTDIELKLKFLNTSYFGGFCEPSKDLNQVCTMHANCCFGLESKRYDLRIMLQDWKQFTSLPLYLKKSSQYKWRVPQNCSIENIRSNDTFSDDVEEVEE